MKPTDEEIMRGLQTPTPPASAEGLPEPKRYYEANDGFLVEDPKGDIIYAQHYDALRTRLEQSEAARKESEKRERGWMNARLAESDGTLAEKLVAAERRCGELERLVEIRGYEAQRNRAMFDSAIKQLLAIHSFVKAGNVELPDGRKFEFHPKDELVREAWTALSDAIRAIPTAIDAATAGERKV